ncbi:MAG: hypothetical protein PHH68_02310 [Candidatus Omnitrophica bacterium]|jgi:hypothetical protein|nr:hypothetical protein [Candidatus Omnitrophota bacterium]MDD5079144.1 hypothetical protein [Candidatus Omnitrophota bacterium]
MSGRIKFLSAIFVVVLAVCPNAAFADTLILTDGQKIEGKIIKKADSFIRIEENGIPITYFSEEIKEIIESPLAPAAADINPPGNTAVNASPYPDAKADGDTRSILAAEPPANQADAPRIDLRDLDRDKLTSTIKNFFLHQYDADLTQFFTSVTDEFREIFLFNRAKRNIRQANDIREGMEDFTLDDIVLNADNNSITVSVSFFLSASYKTVILKREVSGWKINNIQHAQGESWVENPGISNIPDYDKITEVIWNFFLHQNDADLTQCFTSVTDEFRKIRQAHMKKRRVGNTESLSVNKKNFRMFTLDLTGNTGMANVSFNSGPLTMRVIMKRKGDDWKVNEIINSTEGAAPARSY